MDAAHLSIVVLPFTNLSGDPSQDYFADGITENLTTDLSRIRNSFVIARNTAFTFKGRNIPVKEISKELGVRYVLEGSVQRDGNHVRVNAQLIDGQTGAHLWADRFEEEMVDVFKLQDQVVARLANTLGYELVKAEAEKSTHSENPDAIDLTMRGWAILNQLQLITDKDSLAKALGLFEQALKLDPNNVDALVGAAAAERYVFFYGGMDEKPGQITKIEELLAHAIRIDPKNARAHTVRGMIYRSTKRTKEAAEFAQNAVRLNPNYAQLAQDQVTPAEKSAGDRQYRPSHQAEPARSGNGSLALDQGQDVQLYGPVPGRDPGRTGRARHRVFDLVRLLTSGRGIRLRGPASGSRSRHYAGSQTKPQIDHSVAAYTCR